MAITWYTSAGQPSDSVGVAGDLNWDTTNRITWGPKASTNTWVGTAYSNIGPTGPAQLSYSGTPPSAFGQIGNGCCDVTTGLLYLKSSSGWTQTGTIIGPTGATGPTSLLTQSVGIGQSLATTATLSSAATVLTFPGTTIVPTIAFSYSNALMGAIFLNQSSASAVFSLVDTTTSTVIYSLTVSTGTVSNVGQFAATAYPMIASHTFQWQMTGTAAAAGSYVTPMYLYPAASPSYNVSSLPMCGRSTSTTYSGTYTALYLGAGTVSYTFKNTKACSLYYVNVYNQTTASITVGFANYTANAFLWNLGVCAAGSTASYGPYAVGAYAFAVGSQYYWSAAGSGTGTVYVDSAVIYSAS